MPRSISEATTRLPDPPTVNEDAIRHYQLRPIPGQLNLFPREPTVWSVRNCRLVKNPAHALSDR